MDAQINGVANSSACTLFDHINIVAQYLHDEDHAPRNSAE
jgi:hypothetical protein